MAEPSTKRNLCDLTVDRDLLDTKFDGYKLCLEQLRIDSRRLPSNVNVVSPSSDQYSFQHARLFSSHNHLYMNTWTVDQEIRRVYVLLLDGVYCLQLEKGKNALTDLVKVSEFEIFPNDYSARLDKLNASLSFPSHDLAIFSDGCGSLLFCTIEYGDKEMWTLIHREEKLCEDCSFILVDSRSRCTDENGSYVDVLLEYVEEMENQSHNPDQTVFGITLEWITFKKPSGCGAFSVHRRRRFRPVGSVDYAALSVDCNSICCLSSKPLQFVYDSAKPVDLMEVNTKEDIPKEYSWGQTADEICIVFTLGPDISKDKIEWSLQSKNIRLALKQESEDRLLLEGELHLPVDVEASTWTLVDGRLEITLKKLDVGRMWPEVIPGDKRGEYIADPDLVKEVSERLKQFTSDTEVNSTQADGLSSLQQLEECDAADDGCDHLAWLDGETHLSSMEANVAGHQWLFNITLRADQPPFICLRHDVDGILWSHTDGRDHNWTHSYTFNAFGYVQAGKPDRKFCTCSTDATYAVVVDCTRYAYIYWQPSAVSSDLRNRKTGQRVPKVAKQQVVSIPVDSGDGSYSMDMVGVTALDDVLLLLTKDRLVAAFVK